MRPDLLRWLGCGLVAALGLLAVTMAPREPAVAPSSAHDAAAHEPATAVASAQRAQP